MNKSPLASPKPTRNFTPTPFKIVANPLPADRFHANLRANRMTYYREMLKSLADAKRGSVACVESAKAITSVKRAAEKLGYECHYAEDAGKLYVQIISTGDDK